MNIQLLLIVIALTLPKISFAAEPSPMPIFKLADYNSLEMQRLVTQMIKDQAHPAFFTPFLHGAAGHNDIPTINLILASNKIGPNAKLGVIGGKSPSPIFAACINRNTPAVACLIGHKANIEERDKFGRTPLIASSLLGDRPTISLLLASKADVFAKDQYGNDALMTNLQNARGNSAEQILKAMVLQASAATRAKEAEERKAPAKSAPK